jgi:quercetin dioxygenase-like cupin family protein
MHRLLIPSLALAAACATTPPHHNHPEAPPTADPPPAAAHAGDTPVVMLEPDRLEWSPSGVLPAGASMAVLEGDPAREGFFAVRLRFPPNYRIPPHIHPAVERVTVVEGTFYLGHGETWDDDRLVAYPPGSYISMPVGMKHFAAAGDEQVIIQLASIGPWGITYLDPADDPRNQTPQAEAAR